MNKHYLILEKININNNLVQLLDYVNNLIL